MSVDQGISDNRRVGGIRVTVCDPVLIINSSQYKVHDFSRTGFEVDLPGDYRMIGATAVGELHFQTTGLNNVQEVEFEVVRIAPSGRVGAVYKARRSWSTYREGFVPKNPINLGPI
jgi:hypothetical protein